MIDLQGLICYFHVYDTLLLKGKSNQNPWLILRWLVARGLGTWRKFLFGEDAVLQNHSFWGNDFLKVSKANPPTHRPRNFLHLSATEKWAGTINPLLLGGVVDSMLPWGFYTFGDWAVALSRFHFRWLSLSKSRRIGEGFARFSNIGPWGSRRADELSKGSRRVLKGRMS